MIFLRLALVLPAAVAFGWFAYGDQRFHNRGRVVGRLENALHAGLGLGELALIGGALAAAPRWWLGGAVVTALLGGLDEYVFHRNIPVDEASLHAKGHLALFLIVVAASVMR